MAIYKSKRVYYKYQDWVQPVLSSNGTMGGDKFACDQSSVYSGSYAWTAFKEGGMWHSAEGQNPPQWLSWYNPNPLKIDSIEITVGNSSVSPDLPNDYKIQGSNDNTNWVDVYSGTNTQTSPIPLTMSIDLTNNPNRTYKYWRYYIVNVKSRNFGNASNIKITAQEVVEGTSSDHDYSVVESDKIKDVYKSTERKYYKYGTEPNASIVGSFARIDKGVASGFAGGQYLRISEPFSPSANPWEICFPFILSGIDSSAQTIVGTNSSYVCGNIILRLIDGKFVVFATSNGTQWNVINNVIGTKVFTAGVKYFAKMSFDGNTYKISYSEDGVDFIDDIVVNNTTPVFQGQGLSIGGHYYSSTSSDGYFTLGTIDLNESYININGERWWSGDSYTKVGSWIDDGVVSGFSTSNYLTATGGSTVSTDNLDSFEIQCKITTPSSWTSNGRIINPTNGADSTTAPFIEVNSNIATLTFYNGSAYNNFTALSKLDSNTTYWFKWIYDGAVVKSYYSTDGIAFTLNLESVPQYKPFFNSNVFSVGGRSYDKNAVCVWNGSIDLTQSYIKINGQTWWHGTKAVETTPDDAVYSDVLKKRIVAAYKTGNRKYYKYQDWEQPVLTANGTIGGDSFAVKMSAETGTDYAYKAFDGKEDTLALTGYPQPQWLMMYNPNPLNVSKIEYILRNSNYWATSLDIQASDDGSDSSWITLLSLSGLVKQDYIWDIDTGGKFYKYYRLYIKSADRTDPSASTARPAHISELKLTAQESVESTSSDYDYSEVKAFQLVYNLKYNLNSNSAYAKEGTVSGTNRFGADTGETTSENLNQTSIFTFNTPAPAGKWTGSFRYYSQVNFSMNQVYWRLTYEDGTQEYAYGPTSLGDTAYGGGERATISISFTAKKPIKTVTVYAQGSGGGSGRYGGLEYIQMFFDGSKQ